MNAIKLAAMTCAVVLAALFLVPWAPTPASALTNSAVPAAIQTGSGQIMQFAPVVLRRADWDRGDRDRGDWDRGGWGGDWDGGGVYFGSPYYSAPYYTPYYYGRPYGFYFNF